MPTFPFGAHVAVVEVDTETGEVELRRHVAVDDAGTIINPVIAEGQVHGGVAAGVAQALFEEFLYDEEGNPHERELPRLRVRLRGRASLVGPRRDGDPDAGEYARREGHRRVGDDRGHPAIQSAVIDALAPFGIRHIDMPVNGERVWRALQDAKA